MPTEAYPKMVFLSSGRVTISYGDEQTVYCPGIDVGIGTDMMEATAALRKEHLFIMVQVR